MNNKELNNSLFEQQRELSKLINRFTNREGINSTAIQSLELIRVSNGNEYFHSILEPSLCIVAQGSMLVLLGNEIYKNDPNFYLTTSLKLPITAKFLEATPHYPYLCAKLSFSIGQILEIIKKSNEVTSERKNLSCGLMVNNTNSLILDAVIRLINLLNTPKDIPVLAPLVICEILYRILQDNPCFLLTQFTNTGSNTQAMAKVVNFINDDIKKPIRINDLARMVNMSPSSLHHRFKEVTAMSPLQYQKQMRLLKARNLLLSEITEAAEAGLQVGYESPSQFSREYARMFGLPPINDIKRLRNSSYECNF